MRQTLKYAKQRKIRGWSVSWVYDCKKLHAFRDGSITHLTNYSTGRAGVYVMGMNIFRSGRI